VLSIILILVLAALGLLVTALVTASSFWAWLSVAISGMAALLLIVDYLRRRARRGKTFSKKENAEKENTEKENAEAVDEDNDEQLVSTTSEFLGQSREEGFSVSAAQTDLIANAGEFSAIQEPERSEESQKSEELGEDVQPKTDAPEVAGETSVVATAVIDSVVKPARESINTELEVFVVDEHPYYHLAECGWLKDRDIIPISYEEALSLGFTSCSRCTPDAHLKELSKAS